MRGDRAIAAYRNWLHPVASYSTALFTRTGTKFRGNSNYLGIGTHLLYLLLIEEGEDGVCTLDSFQLLEELITALDPLIPAGNNLLLLLFVDLGIILVIRVLKNVVCEQKLPERGGGIIGLLLVELLGVNELFRNDISLLDEILSAQGSLEILLEVKSLTV